VFFPYFVEIGYECLVYVKSDLWFLLYWNEIGVSKADGKTKLNWLPSKMDGKVQM